MAAPATPSLRLAVLGDSIAYGQGALDPADRPAARLTRDLEGRGAAVAVAVFAVPGARMAALRAQVDRTLGWGPNLVVLVIGANDLSHRVPSGEAAQALGDAVRRLREAGAEVVVAPAPDLSAVPHVPEAYRGLVRAGSALLRARQAEAVLAVGGRLADRDGTTSAAFARDGSLFSGDRFHPSASGYAVIVEALLPEVRAAAGLAWPPA